MTIRMKTGSKTSPPRPGRQPNRNREILAEQSDLDPQVKRALQQGAGQGSGRITPSVIAAVVAVLVLAVGMVVWLFQK